MKRILTVACLAAVMALLAPVTPASAATYQPDAFIKYIRNDSYHGRNMYNDTAVGQTAKTVIGPGGLAVFKTKLQNDGSSPDADYSIQGCDGSSKFAVRYAEPDGTNVSSQVKDGLYKVTSKEPGETRNLLFIGIKAKGPAGHGDVFRCKLRVDSQDAPGQDDTVRARVKVD